MATYDEKPELGDLIEIFRGLYQHWGVYVGDGFIVHLTSLSGILVASVSSMMSGLTEKAIVKKEKLEDVVGTDRCQINNSLDKKHKPRSVRVIVREACAKVGEELPYSVFSENCEHFANELRYGISESRQARKAGETILVAGETVLVAGLGVITFTRVLFEGGKKENKNTE